MSATRILPHMCPRCKKGAVQYPANDDEEPWCVNCGHRPEGWGRRVYDTLQSSMAMNVKPRPLGGFGGHTAPGADRRKPIRETIRLSIPLGGKGQPRELYLTYLLPMTPKGCAETLSVKFARCGYDWARIRPDILAQAIRRVFVGEVGYRLLGIYEQCRDEHRMAKDRVP